MARHWNDSFQNVPDPPTSGISNLLDHKCLRKQFIGHGARLSCGMPPAHAYPRVTLQAAAAIRWFIPLEDNGP